MMSQVASLISSPSALFLLVDIQYCTLPTGHHQKDNETSNYSLIVVTDGKGKLKIEEEHFHMDRESCFLIGPEQSLFIQAVEPSLCFYQLTFNKLSIQATASLLTKKKEERSDSFPFLGAVTCSPFSKCLDLVEAIYCHRNDADDMERFYNHVRFEELLRFVFQQNTSQSHLDIRRAVERSVEHVRKHYYEPMTVDQLAADANVARYKYTRIFKEMTGHIPLDFVNKLRIDRAKQLLSRTDDRIHEIAEQVGFNNEFYFNRRFKQMVGVAPGQYRDNQRSDLRIVSLFLEDYLLALGVTPIVQWSHGGWGKLDYLGLQHIPTHDVLTEDIHQLSHYNPDFIMVRQGVQSLAGIYDQCRQIARTSVIHHPVDDWRSTLRTVADMIGRTNMAEQVIMQYENKVAKAKEVLSRSVKGQTFAFLRVSANYISIDYLYTGPVLYRDLGMKPHPLVSQLRGVSERRYLSWEDLSELDADHLFYTFDKWHDEGEDAEKKQLYHPTWQSIPAVQKKRVYEVDFMTWMSHGVIANSRKIDDVMRVLAY
ncbi:transcriptional regulator [Brevibacillus laterosporus]|nr:transcriptional regulator [Brevibacillus laterosporus]